MKDPKEVTRKYFLSRHSRASVISVSESKGDPPCTGWPFSDGCNCKQCDLSEAAVSVAS